MSWSQHPLIVDSEADHSLLNLVLHFLWRSTSLISAVLTGTSIAYALFWLSQSVGSDIIIIPITIALLALNLSICVVAVALWNAGKWSRRRLRDFWSQQTPPHSFEIEQISIATVNKSSEKIPLFKGIEPPSEVPETGYNSLLTVLTVQLFRTYLMIWFGGILFVLLTGELGIRGEISLNSAVSISSAVVSFSWGRY